MRQDPTKQRRGQGSAPPDGATFALGHALRVLATRPHAFLLHSAQVPDLVADVRVEPLDRHAAGSGEIARFRRSAAMLREGRCVARMEAITEVDLATRRFLSNVFDDWSVVARASVALPAHARIGESGELFTAVLADVSGRGFGDAGDAGNAGQASAGAGSRMRWSLEPWSGARALWCLHVVGPAGDDPVSSECCVITASGEIVGRVQRIRRDDSTVLELRTDVAASGLPGGALRA